jgi:hypothetical protein
LTEHRVRRVRPRYGRLAAASSALAITLVTLLGGLGVLPDGGSAAAADTGSGDAASLTALTIPDAVSPTTRTDARQPAPQTTAPDTTSGSTDLPASSGTGKRVVFDISDQRVWLVDPADGEDEVERTYLVSGSLTDNLDPGSYEVYSRSERAWGIEDSGTMRYFVRFAHGDNAAIGFHDIPVDGGSPVQRVDQLGTPLSHGCVRQRRADAIALWRFAPLGTRVVVTA